MKTMEELGVSAQKASGHLAKATSEQKNDVLIRLADLLLSRDEKIFTANEVDVSAGKEASLSEALLDRLTLNPSRLSGILDDLRRVAEMPDPVGEIFEQTVLPNGLQVRKQRVPIGVLGVIYEARPNVTIDIAGLAIKTGNAVILRGGSETINSNRVLVSVIQEALTQCGLPAEVVQFIDDISRERVAELLTMHRYIDMLIPRGGAALHKYCRENSTIPVITGGIGICHLYVDQSADIAQSVHVIQNAKVQRPSVCNSLDTTLIHQEVAAEMIPLLINRLAEDGVAFRLDESAMQFLHIEGDATETKGFQDNVQPAGAEDFDTEWLSLILGVKVVSGLDEAIEHISIHSTGHSDGILTQDEGNARRFIAEVDSAAVYVNASTRFTDGGQLGLGAEVAISTQRLHARGPMGLRELTTYKWVIEGNYQVRE
ncbi:MAG: glutamate-5-semialdehyde dehydrogenase [Anaerolineales bacterium]|nr:glutamate-5-semialdehyde dehydrogenase [Anaerolineales bacterium]